MPGTFDLDRMIKKYRGLIIERLYAKDGYEFDRIVHLSDGYRDVLMIVYTKEKRKKEQEPYG